jgi:hypothetical protein
MKRRSSIVAFDRTFSVILEPQPEGGFTVFVPALLEAAVSMIARQLRGIDTAAEGRPFGLN